jgi:integrase
MASILEIKRTTDTVYRAQVRRPGYPNQTKTFPSKDLANDWANQIERDIRLRRLDPEALAEEKILSDAVSIYLAKKIDGSKNERDTTRLLKWWESQLGLTRLSDVTAIGIGIDQCLDKLCCKDQTKNPYLGALSGCLTFISKTPYQWIQINACKAVTRRKEGEARKRIITPSEWKKLMQAADRAATKGKTQMQQLPFFLRLAYETGRRRGELLKLRRVDVNMEDGVLHLMDTKSGQDQESVISPEVVALLKTHESNVRKAGLKYVFSGRMPNTPTSFDEPIRTLMNDLFEPDRYDEMPVFHSIRHTVATEMGDGGATEAEIMSVTGHSSSASVNRYVKKTRESARAGQAKRKTWTSPFRAPQGPGGGSRLWAAAHVY